MTTQCALAIINDAPSDWRKQAMLALELSQNCSVAWLVPTKARAKKYAETLAASVKTSDEKKLHPVYIVTEDTDNTVPVDIGAIIDQGMSREYYSLPSGVIVPRIVPLIRYKSLLQNSCGAGAQRRLVPVYLAQDTKNNLSLKYAELVAERTNFGLTPLLTAAHKRGVDAGLSDATTVMMAFVGCWTNDIFALGAIDEYDAKYEIYRRWIGENDLQSIANFAALVLAVPTDKLATWSESQGIYLPKLQEILRVYKYWSSRLHPDDTKSVSVDIATQLQRTNWISIFCQNCASGAVTPRSSWENEYCDIVEIGADARLSQTPLHEEVKTPNGPVFSIISHYDASGSGMRIIDLFVVLNNTTVPCKSPRAAQT